MTPSTQIARRGFLTRLAAGTAALAAAGLPATARAERVLRFQSEDPDAWLDALTGKHRQIYDVISPKEAANGVFFARNFLDANNSGYGLTDKEINAVVSFRHMGFAMGLNDAMWKKYSLGEMVSWNDPETKAPAVRNTVLGSAGDTNKDASTIRAVHARGGVFTVCGMAMRAFAGMAAKKTGGTAAAVLADFQKNLVPGGVEVVAGVIAVNRAQERGLSYVYVG